MNFKKRQNNLRDVAQALFTLCIGFISLTLFGCRQEHPVAQKYEVVFAVQMPEGLEAALDGFAIRLSGNNLTQELTAVSNSAGKVSFSLEAGEYAVSASKTSEAFAFNAALSVTVSEKASFTLKLHATSLTGGLVFKEIYYSGSKTETGGKYYSDQFVEIYNNSDEVIYLDGLGIMAVSPAASLSPSKWIDGEGNLLPRYPSDGYVCYIPGSGKEHPLQPRTGIVIAQDGINHKTDKEGNPQSPVNLGNADWEFFVGEINGGKDADAAAVPNVAVMYATQTTRLDMLVSVFGPAMILFRLPEGMNPVEFAANPDNISTAPGESNGKTKYLLIPKEYVIDAVEGVRPDKLNKRLHPEHDAGHISCESSYNSKSIRRKVDKIVDGKVFYLDTNNSGNDFLGDRTPTPGVHPTQIDR